MKGLLIIFLNLMLLNSAFALRTIYLEDCKSGDNFNGPEISIVTYQGNDVLHAYVDGAGPIVLNFGAVNNNEIWQYVGDDFVLDIYHQESPARVDFSSDSTLYYRANLTYRDETYQAFCPSTLE